MGGSVVLLACVMMLAFLAFMLMISAIKIVPEYERGVIFRLGRLVGARGPGLFLVIPVFLILHWPQNGVELGFEDVDRGAVGPGPIGDLPSETTEHLQQVPLALNCRIAADTRESD
jgi:hypothetical protein